MNPAVAEWTVEALARLMLTFAIVVGIAIIAGGEARFSGPSYTVAMRLPGAPETWGVMAALPGAIGLIGNLRDSRMATEWSLYAVAMWCIFFAYSFLHTIFYVASAGMTGVCVYGALSVVCIVLAVAYRNID